MRRRSTSTSSSGVLLLSAFLLLLTAPPAVASADLYSYALVQKNGTLVIAGHSVHLLGIYIPPTGKTCRTFITPVLCGPRAYLALDFKIGPHFVRCRPEWTNEDGSLTAVCRVKGEDLGAYLIAEGWALALPDAPFEYQAAERIARHHGVGVWGIPADTIIRRR